MLSELIESAGKALLHGAAHIQERVALRLCRVQWHGAEGEGGFAALRNQCHEIQNFARPLR